MTHTVASICKRYSVGEGVVLEWIRAGELAAVNVSKRAGAKRPTWRVTEAALAAFEAARTATPPAPRANRRPRRPANVIEFY